MSFLFPLFLFGGALIAAPIVAHLIRRSPKEKMPFSTLMFLSPSEPTVSKKSRLDHIILLILRCLAILLIAFAFARPYLRGGALPMSDAAPAVVTIIAVDTSASMRRDGVWDAAVRRARDAVADLPSGSPLGLISFDRQARVEARPLVTAGEDGASHRDAVIARLGTLEPGFHSSHLDDALIMAGELFDEAVSTQDDAIPFEGRVIVISDFASGMETEDVQGYEWPERLQFEWLAVKPSRAGNAGIELLAGDRSNLSLNQPVRVRVRNSDDNIQRQFSLQWKSGLGAVTNSIVIVPAGESRIVSIADPEASDIVLRGDAADFDDRVFRVAAKREPVTVGYVGREAAGDVRGQLFYLRQVFAEGGDVPVVLKTSTDFDGFGIEASRGKLVFVGPDVSGNDQAMRDFIRGGGTLVIATGDNVAGAEVAQRVAEDAVQVSPGGRTDYLLLGSIDFQHPLFSAMSEARFSDFTKIHFWKHATIQTRDDLAEGVSVIARFDNGDPAVVEKRVGDGRLILLGFAWSPDQSQFALSSKFVPTLFSLLELSGSVKLEEPQRFVGDSVTGSTFDLEAPVTMTLPDGSTVELNDDSERFTASMPGIHQLADRNRTVRIPVNLVQDESDTTPMDLDGFERLGLPVMAGTSESPETELRERAHLMAVEREARQKLWKWLIAAAVLILIAETIYAGRLGIARPAVPTS